MPFSLVHTSVSKELAASVVRTEKKYRFYRKVDNGEGLWVVC
jgi:hypothetical protein